MRCGLFLISILSTSFAFAAGTPAISFYRSQQSLFPSGQASRDVLENKILRRDFEPWLRVSWNNKSYALPGETILRDVQVTQELIAKESLTLVKDPQDNAKAVASIKPKTALKVLSTNSYWAELYDSKQKIQGWAPLHLLEAPVEDIGVYVTLIDSFLKKGPQTSGGIITTVPRMQRLTALGIEKTFLKVSYQGHVGYLDLANLVGRADFAMWAYHKSKGWLGISHRENGFLFTVDSQKIPLEQFIAFNPYTNRGVACQKLTDDAPSIRSRVEIASNKAHRWALSALEGHGTVWWRMEEPESDNKAAIVKEITTEELMKREVTAVDFANKSLKGLASANGIFRTEDGKSWKEIAQFSGKNFPVAVHPDGVWYVGNYRSFDEGKTFEAYIKWDKLAERIQAGIHKTPRHLRIAQIEPLSHSRVRIHVDTGTQKVKLQAHILSQEWLLVK